MSADTDAGWVDYRSERTDPRGRGGHLRRTLPADRARGLGAGRIAGGVPHRPLRALRRGSRRPDLVDGHPARALAAPTGRGRDPGQHHGRGSRADAARVPPLLHFAKRLDVQAWWPRPIRTVQPTHLVPYSPVMRATATFDLSAPPDQVLTYLSNPRNIVIANNDGPVVEQSDPPLRAGSWSVLAFDQASRVRSSCIRPLNLRRWLAASTTVNGRGVSAAWRGVVRLTSSPTHSRGTGGTRVTLDAESSGGWMPGPVGPPLLADVSATDPELEWKMAADRGV